MKPDITVLYSAETIAARNAALSAQTGFESTLEKTAQAELLRDLFANPFRPLPTVDPAWRSSAVLEIAQTIYFNREFTSIPALADLLAAAGCDNESILQHCHSDRTHARGCWLIDLLLGMS